MSHKITQLLPILNLKMHLNFIWTFFLFFLILTRVAYKKSNEPCGYGWFEVRYTFIQHTLTGVADIQVPRSWIIRESLNSLK